MNNFAYIHYEDRQKWVRIIEGNEEWDEPIAGWTMQVMLCHGYNNLISPNGKIYRELASNVVDTSHQPVRL